jgi:hypothetical protein
VWSWFGSSLLKAAAKHDSQLENVPAPATISRYSENRAIRPREKRSGIGRQRRLYETIGRPFDQPRRETHLGNSNLPFRSKMFDSRLEMFNIGSLAVVHLEHHAHVKSNVHWVDAQDCHGPFLHEMRYGDENGLVPQKVRFTTQNVQHDLRLWGIWSNMAS